MPERFSFFRKCACTRQIWNVAPNLVGLRRALENLCACR